MKIFLNSIEDTKKLAKLLSSLVENKLFLTLTGDLAAGKTTLTKFLAKNLGVKETVTSPTFNILKEYQAKNFSFYHIDAYRLENSEDDLGFEEIFFEDNVCVVEWGEFIEDFLPKEKINIKIENKLGKRELTLSSEGDYYNKMLKKLEERWQV